MSVNGKTVWQRLVMCGALVAATAVCMTGTANAATSTCLGQSYSDGARIVPGTGGGHVTRSITRQQARNTWDDWVWRGEKVVCSRNSLPCSHSWTRSETVNTGWAIGGGTDIGNSSSPSKKWYNVVLPLVIGYQKTTEISKNTTIGVTVKPGHTAQEVIIAVRRWTQGDFAGGWVRTNRGCRSGTAYEWNGNLRYGNWTRNVFVENKYGWAVDGRI
ncbi:hypothetical protein KMT30_37205 [Streptomyces sp. IBSBF 2953]|uniref:hypothetical protein n=1 Tax=Streptomyces TaxID=1883 RepID=UPI002119F2DF|nr:hypothetical protein [Streptomyces scabiei]MCQ9184584.1 hypothetical protein [Streptomyces hayashii]MDX3115428.1 hypothetical protein [Streptomyces scabiei]